MPSGSGPRKSRKRSFFILAPLLGWIGLELLSAGTLWILPAAAVPVLPEDDPEWLISAKDAWQHRFFKIDEHTIWRPNPGYREKASRKSRYGTVELRIDDNGHRARPDAPEKPAAKPEGVRRVLLVGGSHPFGMWVNPEEAYIEVLGELLNRQGSGRWEVMNAACPGHTTFQGRKYIEEYGLAFAPDIVLFDLGMNDTLPLAVTYATPDHEVQAVPSWAGYLGERLGSLPSYGLLKRAMASVVGRPNPSQVRVPLERQLANQDAVRKLGQSEGFKTLFFSQVAVTQIGPGGRAHCKYIPEGFSPYADVCEAFEQLKGDAGLYFHDPIHANAQGHAIIAETVFAKLNELGWTQSP
jgi:lysophospholipase L1-like esterase